MTNDEYHADTSMISNSGLKLIGKSPAHYYAKYLDPNRAPQKRTNALRHGSAIHAAVLEPTEFKKLFATVPENAPNKPSKSQLNAKKPSPETLEAIAWWEAFNAQTTGKEILSQDEYQLAENVKDAIYKHPAAAMLLEMIRCEEVYTFIEPNTGAPCKIKLDALSENTGLIVDIKTTEDASDAGCVRAVLKYGYDHQAAMYFDGYLHATGNAPNGFAFIFVEKDAPFAVNVKYAPAEMLALGRRKYLANCAKYVECLHTGEWPAYGHEITPIELPEYILNR
jgi:exodeoxyribonuclease VIII